MGNLLQTLPMLSPLVVVLGYLGYRLSCSGVGMRRKHTVADITFQSFIFGALSVFFAYLISLTDWISSDNQEFWYLSIGGIISLVVAIWWAKTGRSLAIRLKLIDDRVDDDNSRDIRILLLDGGIGWHHIDVYLNSGEILESSFGKIPDDWPHRDGIFSHAGDVAIYVTGITKDGQYKDTAVLNEGKKYNAPTITFVSANSIKFIDLQLEK